METISKAPQQLMLLLLRGYRLFLSPWMGQRCRFHPTCSNYASESFEVFGFTKGLAYTLHRLCRCHPWAQGGCDPVPTSTKGDYKS